MTLCSKINLRCLLYQKSDFQISAAPARDVLTSHMFSMKLGDAPIKLVISQTQVSGVWLTPSPAGRNTD